MDALKVETVLARAIGWLTLVTGAVQLVVPTVVLSMIAPASSPAEAHLFATVGMFMVVVGGILLQSVGRSGPFSAVLVWCALQKLAASALVALAVVRGLFVPLALLVASVDFASGLLLFDLRRRGR